MKIFADCGDLKRIAAYAKDPRIEGFTTNPSILAKEGIKTYREFARSALDACGGKEISLEVLADDFETMEKQAREIASWGKNVWVKIPVTNTRGQSTKYLIRQLADLNLNVTAVMTQSQVEEVIPEMRPHHVLSVFNGRITDTQRGSFIPARHRRPPVRWLWASTRHVGSLWEAKSLGYDIITMTPDLIDKLSLAGKNLTEYSQETVQMFYVAGKGISF